MLGMDGEVGRMHAIDCAYHMPDSIKALEGMLACSTIEAAL